jgi:hypothetical protein
MMPQVTKPVSTSRPPKGRVWPFSVVLVSCAAATSAPNPPPFLGEETEWWLVQETEPTGRVDILPAFEASAQSYGCNTERIGTKSSLSIHGERRSYFGVSAACSEGTIALITMAGSRVRIGCAKPTTRQACDLLLRSIAEAR